MLGGKVLLKLCQIFVNRNLQKNLLLRVESMCEVVAVPRSKRAALAAHSLNFSLSLIASKSRIYIFFSSFPSPKKCLTLLLIYPITYSLST